MKDLQLFSLSGFSCIKILSDQFICCIYSFSMFELPSFNNNVLLIILLLISQGSRTVIIEDKHYGFSGPQSLGEGGGGKDFNKGSKAWRTLIKATCTLFILDTLK